MKIIAVFIIVAIGIVVWALVNPDQQENLLAVKKAIGIDQGNPYAAKLRTLGEKQQSITEALEKSSSGLNGAILPDKLIATQDEIINEFKLVMQGLENEGGEEELILNIEDSGIARDLRAIKSQLEDGKLSRAADRSRNCARQMLEWADEMDGSN